MMMTIMLMCTAPCAAPDHAAVWAAETHLQNVLIEQAADSAVRQAACAEWRDAAYDKATAICNAPNYYYNKVAAATQALQLISRACRLAVIEPYNGTEYLEFRKREDAAAKTCGYWQHSQVELSAKAARNKENKKLGWALEE